MQVVELIKTIESKTGAQCPIKEPTITQDSLFVDSDGKHIGFYMRDVGEVMSKVASIANYELISKKVSIMKFERADVQKFHQMGYTKKEAQALGTMQRSVIIGSVPAKPNMSKQYKSISRVHAEEKSLIFIKSMIKLDELAGQLIKEVSPLLYEQHMKAMDDVEDQYKLTSLHTGSISNLSASLKLHKDRANLKGTLNVIIMKRFRADGGHLYLPEYDQVIEQCNDSIIVYPAWRDIHAVTPIHLTSASGYRNSLVFYTLNAFKKDLQND